MAGIKTEEVTLHVLDGTTMKGYVAAPEGSGKLQAILIFQEAFGVNAHIREVTKRFAEAGYLAIAPELFHRTGPGFEGAYDNFPAVMVHMQALTPEGMISDARAAFDWRQSQPRVLPNRTACIGFCMGGARFISGKFRVASESGHLFLRRRDCSSATTARGGTACPTDVLLGRARQAHSTGSSPRGHGCASSVKQEICEC